MIGNLHSYAAKAFGARFGEAHVAMAALPATPTPEEVSRAELRLYGRLQSALPARWRLGRRRGSAPLIRAMHAASVEEATILGVGIERRSGR